MASFSIDISGPDLFGPPFWGWIVSNVLFGITLLQGYIYFETRRRGTGQALFVILLLILDTLSAVLMAVSMSDYLLVNFGNPFQLLVIGPKLLADTFILAITPLLIDMFFAIRIYQLSDRIHNGLSPMVLKSASVAIALFSFAASGMALEQTWEAKQANSFALFSEARSKRRLGTALGLSSIAGIIITIGLVATMRTARTGFAKTDRVIRSVILFVANRGILLVAIRILWVATYVGSSSNVWIAFRFCLTRVDVNTFFAFLNSQYYAETHTRSTDESGSRHRPRLPQSDHGVPGLIAISRGRDSSDLTTMPEVHMLTNFRPSDYIDSPRGKEDSWPA